MTDKTTDDFPPPSRIQLKSHCNGIAFWNSLTWTDIRSVLHAPAFTILKWPNYSFSRDFNTIPIAVHRRQAVVCQFSHVEYFQKLFFSFILHRTVFYFVIWNKLCSVIRSTRQWMCVFRRFALQREKYRWPRVWHDWIPYCGGLHTITFEPTIGLIYTHYSVAGKYLCIKQNYSIPLYHRQLNIPILHEMYSP